MSTKSSYLYIKDDDVELHIYHDVIDNHDYLEIELKNVESGVGEFQISKELAVALAHLLRPMEHEQENARAD